MRDIVNKTTRLNGVRVKKENLEGVKPFNMKPVIVADPKFALVSQTFAGIVDDYFKV